ncbi:MAG: SDR family NAD(P)-dependent oxidoreductase [Alphaproteobacteria bacterium]|nr:SDR family NAD(P)-dependent oxidoreductase [Alphaproteobacteria bacterium]
MKKALTVVITGASSGLGKSLALAYAEKGNTLFLTGRNKDRLSQTKSLAEEKGATVYIKVADVRDPFDMETIIMDAAALKPLDIVIANAGVSSNILRKKEETDDIRTVFTTNINGVVNTILPAIYEMKKQKYGHLVLISSLAGYRFIPQAPAYSASKAFIKSWGEGLSQSLFLDNIDVTTVCPGFIETPLTETNRFPMPFMMKSEKAAKIIKRAIEKKKVLLSFPKTLTFFVWLRSFMPSVLLNFIFRRFTKKYLEKSK